MNLPPVEGTLTFQCVGCYPTPIHLGKYLFSLVFPFYISLFSYLPSPPRDSFLLKSRPPPLSPQGIADPRKESNDFPPFFAEQRDFTPLSLVLLFFPPSP